MKYFDYLLNLLYCDIDYSLIEKIINCCEDNTFRIDIYKLPLSLLEAEIDGRPILTTISVIKNNNNKLYRCSINKDLRNKIKGLAPGKEYLQVLQNSKCRYTKYMVSFFLKSDSFILSATPEDMRSILKIEKGKYKFFSEFRRNVVEPIQKDFETNNIKLNIRYLKNCDKNKISNIIIEKECNK